MDVRNAVTDEERDEELRWRLETLRVQFEEGKIHVADHLADDFESSLKAVRYGSDGRIDLSTVDGRVRAMAMMAAVVKNRQDMKDAVSLEEIANLYFEYVDRNLGLFIKEASANCLDAHTAAMLVSRQPLAVDNISPQIPQFLEGLQEFWSALTESSHYHIQDIVGTKAVYGGDLFPSYQKTSPAASAYTLIQSFFLIHFGTPDIYLQTPPLTNRSIT